MAMARLYQPGKGPVSAVPASKSSISACFLSMVGVPRRVFMRLTRSALFVVLTTLALVACGDDGGSSGTPDAKVFMDAPTPAALMGLGQRCVAAMQGADCPASANGCLTFAAGATMGICTKACQPNTMFTTNAQSVPGP